MTPDERRDFAINVAANIVAALILGLFVAVVVGSRKAG